ncbi:MAG: FAD-binding protein [Thermoplasmata archaeon]|uniref:FAD-binding protein n=1 Tax=Candidatus Sysuiplasma superficiale TaxID=2823368 RepID=A0A8J7YN61_9ARCH|nr:FAD-binding protein [Candidatus Sysuiplasma superficiale]MBX8643327.1 FAD-binding protein [Candidatus Sysuiplasma superficiale]MCL5437464.1 FAD-binding protein [Candidatus Thermoplasmatota archaeon]
MKVVVLVKQIPDVNRIELDPSTLRIRREGVPLLMNSFDRKAIEESVRIKEKMGGEVIAVTMGPPASKDVIVEALRMGSDRGYVISDRRFAGADTYITARVLSSFITGIKPDLVLAGKYSLDGETSQVPPEIATIIGYPFKSAVTKIEFIRDGQAVSVEQEREDGMSLFEMDLPAVLSVSEKINRARMPLPPSPDFEERVRFLDSSKLQCEVGGADSPTVVMGTEAVSNYRKVRFLNMGEEAFRCVLELAEGSVPAEAEELHLPPDCGKEELWGVALNDVQTAYEIASKLSEIALENGFRVRIIGNIEPGKLNDLLCHEYEYIDCSENELIADTIASEVLNRKPRCIILPSTVDGREIAPSIAARTGLGLTADCIDLRFAEGRLLQYKPAFGGGIVASITSRTVPEMATVRQGMLRRRKGTGTHRMIVSTLKANGAVKVRRTGHIPVDGTYRPLHGSNIVIGLGRGLRGSENVRKILPLAERLGAAVGGTRPIVDAGWIPRQQQIGLTGTSISPGLYIALGISGQDNHVVGIRYAGKVVAVNSRQDAPIFRYADIGIVGDLFEFVEGMCKYIDIHRTAKDLN